MLTQTQAQTQKQMQQLTGQALQKYIQHIIIKPIFLSFSTIMNLPQFSNLKNKQSIDNLLAIFIKETYQSFKATSSNIKLDDKQIKKLRQLSVLTIFQGISTFCLSKLARFLDLDSLDCIQLLLQMNINKLIKVKIDEENNVINIYFAKRRQLLVQNNQVESSRIMIIQGKISKIIKDNNCLQTQIKAVLENQQKTKSKSSLKEKEKEFDFDFERRYKF